MFRFFFAIGVIGQLLSEFYERAADAFVIGLTTDFDISDLSDDDGGIEFESDEDFNK